MTNPKLFAAYEEPILRAARAVYEADEDMTDEAIATMCARGDYTWNEARNPRLPWDDLPAEIQKAYYRRARAAIAANNYVSGWTKDW